MNTLLQLIKAHGVRGTLYRIIGRLNHEIRIFSDRGFDRKFGVETSGIVWVAHLDIGVAQKRAAQHYEPTPTSAVRSMLKRVTIDHSEYTFIDFGSGKGRVLLLASEYPYKRIIGLEFSQSLHGIAQNNIEIWSSSRQKCPRINSICIDAREFDLPNEPLVIFFFTPFQIPVAAEVINSIQESYKQHPRPMHIIYYGANREFFALLTKLNFKYREIYSHRPLSALKKYKGTIFISESHL